MPKLALSEQELKILSSLDVKDNEAALCYQNKLASQLVEADIIEKATKHAHTGLSYWNAFRDFIFRFHNLMSLLGRSFLNHLSNIAGLAYGIGLVADLIAITKEALVPIEKNKSLWKRLADALHADEDRKLRLSKNSVSFACNLGIFLASHGTSVFFNFASLLFDICFVTYKYFAKTTRDKLLDKINLEIKAIENNIDEESNTEALRVFKFKLQEEKRSRAKNAFLVITCALCCAVLLTALFFPPVAIPTWIAIACGIGALIAGSGFSGLGPLLMKFADSTRKKINGYAQVADAPLSSQQLKITHSEKIVLKHLQVRGTRESVSLPSRYTPLRYSTSAEFSSLYSTAAIPDVDAIDDTVPNDPNITTRSPCFAAVKVA